MYAARAVETMTIRERRLAAIALVTLAVACACRQEGSVMGEDKVPKGTSAPHEVPAPMQDRVRKAAELMLRFAERSGLAGDGPARRYLWTDAFAVCNFLSLGRITGEDRYTDLA